MHTGINFEMDLSSKPQSLRSRSSPGNSVRVSNGYLQVALNSCVDLSRINRTQDDDRCQQPVRSQRTSFTDCGNPETRCSGVNRCSGHHDCTVTVSIRFDYGALKLIRSDCRAQRGNVAGNSVQINDCPCRTPRTAN